MSCVTNFNDKIAISDIASSPPKGHILLLTNPIGEAWDYLSHFHLPPLSLIGRVAKVATLAIFRWHFHDAIAFPYGDKLYHNLNGKFSWQTKERGIFCDYVKLKNATKLQLKRENFSFSDEEINPEYFKERGINASSIVDYYRDKKYINLIAQSWLHPIRNRFHCYSLWDLLHSDKFENITSTFDCPNPKF